MKKRNSRNCQIHLLNNKPNMPQRKNKKVCFGGGGGRGNDGADANFKPFGEFFSYELRVRRTFLPLEVHTIVGSSP